MPLKKCETCGKEHGVRKLRCDCGFEFIKQGHTKKEVCIGIGAWINDMPKGMPKVEIPEPLPAKPAKLNTADISHRIAYEGIGFCVFSYIDVSRIKDKKLAKIWDKARKILTEVVTYVEEHEQDEEPS